MATRRMPRRWRFPSHEAFDAELVPDAGTAPQTGREPAPSPSRDAGLDAGPHRKAAEEVREAFEVVLELPPGSRGFEEGRRRIEVRANAIAAVRGSLLSW